MAKKMPRKSTQSSRQAPLGVWSPENLGQALEMGTTEEKIALLSKIGILTKDGRLARRYTSWGKVISRTADQNP